MPATSDYITLTAENFETEVIESPIPVLVDFWAAWCGPCRIMNPIVETLATQFAGKAKVAKVNVDEQEEIALRYSIAAIPTLIFFNKGEPTETVAGVISQEDLSQKLEQLVGSHTSS